MRILVYFFFFSFVKKKKKKKKKKFSKIQKISHPPPPTPHPNFFWIFLPILIMSRNIFYSTIDLIHRLIQTSPFYVLHFYPRAFQRKGGDIVLMTGVRTYVRTYVCDKTNFLLQFQRYKCETLGYDRYEFVEENDVFGILIRPLGTGSGEII